MRPVPPVLRRGRKARLEGDPVFLFVLVLFLTRLRRPLLQDTRMLLVLLHVRQPVHGVLNQWTEAFGHHPRVGVQDGGQVGLSQLLPVMQRQ